MVNARNVHFRCISVRRHIAEILKCDSDCDSNIEYAHFFHQFHTQVTLWYVIGGKGSMACV